MRKIRSFSWSATICALLVGIAAHGATLTGTVTNQTTGKPSAGDSVVLVDVQAGMSEAGSAKTDSKGHYSIESPGMGPYLVRVNHQGGTYFIAAPQPGTPGDITVYDVAAKVDGVSVDADMILVEAAGTMLRIQERYLVRNTSLPPRAQYSDNTFEIVLPANAEVDGASATRPGGLGTNTRLVPLSQKGHYTFNIPIQPNKGEKETMFEVQYHTSYNGKYNFVHQVQMATDNLVIYVPKGMSFSGTKGASFQPTQEDPRVQTFITKNVHPGQEFEFSVSGEGQMPREPQGGSMAQQAGAMGGGAGGAASDTANRPGGGLGTPIGTPDPLSTTKWWILGGLSLLLIAAAVFFLRGRKAALAAQSTSPTEPHPDSEHHVGIAREPASTVPSGPPAGGSKSLLLSALKEELFEIESDRINGALSPDEYDQVKVGLEAVLRRTLRKS